MGAGEEVEGVFGEGGAKGGAVGGILDDCAGIVSQRLQCAEFGWDWAWRQSYRSIIVIRGEMRLEAQAAAAMSDVIRHGKSFVFQFALLWGRTVVDFEAGRVRMTFGGDSRWEVF